MIILLVSIEVKPDHIEAFKAASIANAGNSVQEPGIVRFDVIQQTDDPTRFALVEVYRTAEAIDRHKETAHYHQWLDTVAEMMATPRTRTFFTNVFPDDEGW
jgi:(4S)-4-hydroxy-5-phosphonooxypentane-2,3-dione isomerase